MLFPPGVGIGIGISIENYIEIWTIISISDSNLNPTLRSPIYSRTEVSS